MREKIKYIILIFLIIIFIVSIVPKEFQNDTFFTIAIGENILKNGVQIKEQLVWHDNLEFTNPRWLFDVFITTIYNNFNFLGIYVAVIIISILQAILYFNILNKITNKKILSFIITIIVMFFCKHGFTARAQIVSFTLFLLEYYCLESLFETNKKRYFIILAIIPLILVNMHSSVFPMYFVIYLPYIAEFILGKLKLKVKNDQKIIIEGSNIKITKIISLIIIAVLISFVTPRALKPYTYMFKNMGGLSSDFIAELQPLVVMEQIYFLSIVIITFGLIAFTKVKVNIKDLLYIVGFLLMSLLAFRCIYFFYLISTICVARILNNVINEYKINLDFLDKNIQRIILSFLVIFFVSFCLIEFTKNLTKDYVEISDYPVDATEYILNNIDVNNMKIYNHFNFGSYLEFKGIKAFIDSRSEVYTEEFNPGTTILEDWHNIVSGSVSYKDIFDKYGITHVLLYNDEIINTYIKYDKDYNLLYHDDAFSLYEKVNNDK